MYKETLSKLDTFSRSVREGKQVLEAADFARWLEFSGYLKIFDRNPCTDQFFEVRPQIIRKKISDLIQDCGEWFKSGKMSPKYHESDIAEINDKLDQLLAQRAQSRFETTSGGGPGVGLSAGARPLPCLFVTTQSRTDGNLPHKAASSGHVTG